MRNEIGMPDMIRRKEGLTEYLKEHKVLGRKINFSENKMKKLAKKSSFEIAINLLAEALGVGTRKMKSFIADENYTPQEDLIFILPDGKERRVSYDLFYKARLEILNEAREKKQKLSIEYITTKLSRKLKIPQESIAEFFGSGVGVDLFSSSIKPHKNRPTPK